MLIHRIVFSALLALTPLAAGCASEWYSYSYAPMPAEVPFGSADQPRDQGRALVTVLGIHRADSSTQRPAQVEFRMRLENQGQSTLRPLPDTFKLVTAGLEEFAKPVFIGMPAEPLRAGQSATFEIHFPLPAGKEPGDLGLMGLNLNWELEFEGGRRWTCSANFDLVVVPSTSNVSYGVGIGVGFDAGAGGGARDTAITSSSSKN